MLHFKKDGFILAIGSKLPVVPVTILGAGNILPKGSFIVKKGHIKVIVSEAIDTLKMTVEDTDKLLQLSRCAIILNKNYTANEKVRNCELYSA